MPHRPRATRRRPRRRSVDRPGRSRPRPPPPPRPAAPRRARPDRARASGSRRARGRTLGAVPVRLAFVGQRVFFELCSLEHPTDGIAPTFIDFRHDADPRPLRAQLEALDPDVIWVWRPEIVPPGLLHGLRARRVGYLTEPLPRPADDEPHEDLTLRLEYLTAAHPSHYDRT